MAGTFQNSREASMAGADGVRRGVREEVAAQQGQLAHSPGRGTDSDVPSG